MPISVFCQDFLWNSKNTSRQSEKSAQSLCPEPRFSVCQDCQDWW